jgi:hypothetical protein
MCFLLFGPFVRIRVAIGCMEFLCCFVGYLLIGVLGLCFFSEKLIQSWLIFSGGMGFSIFGLLEFGVGRCFFDIILLEGIWRFIG